MQREQRQRDKLRGKGLRRRDADFRSSCVRIQRVLCRARNRRIDDVGDRKIRAPFCAFTNCGQRIGGFSRLRHRDHQIAQRDDRIAITNLTPDRLPPGCAPALQSGTFRRATHETKCRARINSRFYLAWIDLVSVEKCIRWRGKSSAQRIGDGAWFVDFLEHEVFVARLSAASSDQMTRSARFRSTPSRPMMQPCSA